MAFWIRKNNTNKRLDGLPSAYPSRRVTYGDTNVEAELDTINSNLSAKLVYKVCNASPSDTTNYIYSTGVSTAQYFCIGAVVPFDTNIEVRISNLNNSGEYRYTLWDVVNNTKITNGYNYWVYMAFLSRSGLTEIS